MNYLSEGTRRGVIGVLSALFLSYTTLLLATLNQDKVTLDVAIFSKQYLMYGLSGFYFAFLSIIFSIKDWQVSKKFMVHILFTLPFLPIAYVTEFMPHTAFGITSFVGMYLLSYSFSFIAYKVYQNNK